MDILRASAPGPPAPLLGCRGAIILRGFAFAFGFLGVPSFTKNVAVHPFPTPSLSSQMSPCIKPTNLMEPASVETSVSTEIREFQGEKGMCRNALLIYLLERARPNPLPLCNFVVAFSPCANFLKV